MRYFGNEEELEVSTKHIALRIIGFFIAFVIAVAAFSRAVTGIGYKAPGYYDIETNPVEDAMLYAQGISFTHYFDGESDAIKKELLSAKDAYSAALSRAYKLLDAENNYDGFANIAFINDNLGMNVQISGELFDILTDAYAKTLEHNGYNMFAGAVYKAWNDILILEEPQGFDPVNDPYQGERIAAIAQMTADLDNFKLTVLDAEKYIIRIDVSKDYLACLEKWEAEPVIVDLNALHDAYMVTIVRDAMEQNGYDRGYITCGGLTVSLSKHEAGAYCLYAMDNGVVSPAASVPVTPNSVCCALRAFAFSEEELGYYTVTDGASIRYRHPHFDVDSGSFADVVMSSCVISQNGSIVDACYGNIVLNSLDDAKAAGDFVKDHHDFIIAYTLQSNDRVVYTNRASAVAIEDEDFTIN